MVNGCTLIYCWRVTQWDVIPCAAAVGGGQGQRRLLLRASAASMDMVLYGLRHGVLTAALLRKLADRLAVDVRRQASKAELLEAPLVVHIARASTCGARQRDGRASDISARSAQQ